MNMNLLRTLLILMTLLVSASAFAQSLGEGGVPLLFVEPDLGNGGFIHVFFLIGGLPQNKPQIQGGNFDYQEAANDGPFHLNYIGLGGPYGCTFDGHFSSWGLPYQIDTYCVILNGSLQGQLAVTQADGTIVSKHQLAEYVQPLCAKGGTGWASGGSLTTHD
jgi:hypothetical protein